MSRNIRFIQAAISVVKSTHLKPYTSKFSKRIYTQQQHLVLVLFKDYRNQHYRRRQLVENRFSVMKRKFGEVLKARIYRLQVKEIKIKVILYKLSRLIFTLLFLVFIEEFYRANLSLFVKGYIVEKS